MEKYNPDWALDTDLYQLTMAAGYVKAGKTQEKATFNLFFRKLPPNWGFCVAAGLERVITYLLNLRFTNEHINYLRSLDVFRSKDIQGGNFDDFFDYLKNFRFTGSVRAIPEGELIFPDEPMLSVTAPLPEAQIVETFLLQNINFQTLIATKAARICLAAKGNPVMEFGGRRAQGPDGALSASRAAYIGGCDSTSNVFAGYCYGIPVKGTHAHSWVMSFDDESEAFQKYAEVFPDSSVFLIDTYDVLKFGLPNAIKMALELRQKGHKVVGIRLDSGDLVELSIACWQKFQKAGFSDAIIVASSDLDEYEIVKLKENGAIIHAWGVGTRLVTSFDSPALGGVYKLAEIEGMPKIKIAGAKTTNPGEQTLWRCYNHQGESSCDLVSLADEQIPGFSFTLLTRVMIKDGALVGRLPSLNEIKERALGAIEVLPEGYKRIENPDVYPVKFSPKLIKLKESLIKQGSKKIPLPE